MSLRKISGWLLLVLGMLAQAARAEDAFLSLRPQVSVDHSVVLLGDVVEVTARQPAIAERLHGIELARFSSLAKPAKLSRAEIDGLLNQRGALPSGGIAWGGSTEVVISGRLRRIDLAPGIDGAASQLMQALGPGHAVVIRVLDNGGDVMAPPGRTSVRPEMGALYRFGQTVDVPLAVEVDGIAVARPIVRFEVSRSPLDSAQFDPAPRRAAAPVSVDRGSPAELSVEKDRPVRIVVEAGSVRLEGEGTALADAREGDTVKVRRATGGTELLGRAAGPGLVLVEEH
jgi:hypothetical protein